MKLGITADLHLTSKDTHPERWNALLDILRQCKERKVEHLIIAGDLFDASQTNYSEFEALCKTSEFSKVQVLIIPGNHDVGIDNRIIVAKNVHIFDQPAREKLADDWEACFIPYRASQTMGRTISELAGKGSDKKWALVGHGDWIGSLNAPNPYEELKVYMPLTRKDVESLKPDYVFLGHIHVPQKTGLVFYPGSPCAVAVNEVGYRHFLVLDTEKGIVDEVRVNSDVLYFTAKLFVVPSDDEQEYVAQQIQRIKKLWFVDEKDLQRVKIRAEAIGYSHDRAALIQVISKGFSEFRFVEDPDISRVDNANDPEKDFLIRKFREELDQADYDFFRDGEPDKDAILVKAMELTYGRG